MEKCLVCCNYILGEGQLPYEKEKQKLLQDSSTPLRERVDVKRATDGFPFRDLRRWCCLVFQDSIKLLDQ